MRKLGKLSAAEMEVMQVIWEESEAITVAQLVNIFAEEKGWKTSTLSTILSRLINKGYLRKTMRGKANFYETLLTLEQYGQHEAQNLLNGLYAGNVRNFVAALAEVENFTQQDLEELQEWFKDKAGEAN